MQQVTFSISTLPQSGTFKLSLHISHLWSIARIRYIKIFDTSCNKMKFGLTHSMNHRQEKMNRQKCLNEHDSTQINLSFTVVLIGEVTSKILAKKLTHWPLCQIFCQNLKFNSHRMLQLFESDQNLLKLLMSGSSTYVSLNGCYSRSLTIDQGTSLSFTECNLCQLRSFFAGACIVVISDYRVHSKMSFTNNLTQSYCFFQEQHHK